MKFRNTLIIILICSVCSAVALAWVARLAEDKGWINVEVGDRYGYGPDRGAEWDRAAHRKIDRYAVASGVAVFVLLSLAAGGRKRDSANPGEH